MEPSHPGNIGAAARAAKTMCIENLVLVNPAEFPSGQARARAAGALDVLERAQIYDSLKQAIADCTFVVGASARSRGLQCPEVTPSDLGEKVWQELSHGNVAIVFGRESSGLSNEELDQCHYVTTIPANWEFSSLNIASAVQVICYEIYKAYLERNKNLNVQEPLSTDLLATKDELEYLFEHMQQVLHEIEFFDPKQPKLLMRRLRHLYIRARLTQVETNILRGILTAIQKVKRNST
jgi:tRNA (cytidine32/uridine32-2'-O)-methyltransferase